MRVLIVDDHVVVRQGIRGLLVARGDVTVDEAGSSHEALALFRKHPPDVVLLDLNLPGSSGLELLRRLLLEDKRARVLVLSMHAELIYVMRALKAGARGYVSKSASADELATAVRAVAEGRQYVEREIAAQIVEMQIPAEDPLQSLTTREIDILRLLGEGKSLGMIASSLGVTYKTVANSCTIIKGKLGAQRTGDLIRLALDMRSR
jgi:DNA-binding NarL/FixJ family response regulator